MNHWLGLCSVVLFSVKMTKSSNQLCSTCRIHICSPVFGSGRGACPRHLLVALSWLREGGPVAPGGPPWAFGGAWVALKGPFEAVVRLSGGLLGPCGGPLLRLASILNYLRNVLCQDNINMYLALYVPGRHRGCVRMWLEIKRVVILV